jgi:hypothetical protein
VRQKKASLVRRKEASGAAESERSGAAAEFGFERRRRRVGSRAGEALDRTGPRASAIDFGRNEMKFVRPIEIRGWKRV